MSWRLDQTDAYAYTLLDVNNDAIAELNFYDTGSKIDVDTHWIANLVAAAPDLLEAVQYYYEHGDNDRMRGFARAIFDQLNATPDDPNRSAP